MECQECYSGLEFGSVQLSYHNTLLALVAPATHDHGAEWTLMTDFGGPKETTLLRLRFTLDTNIGDFDCVCFMSFEAKPPGATAFEVLGSAEVVPYLFTWESFVPGWNVDRCFCDFPDEYRNEFFHMVAQLGEIRNLVIFG